MNETQKRVQHESASTQKVREQAQPLPADDLVDQAKRIAPQLQDTERTLDHVLDEHEARDEVIGEERQRGDLVSREKADRAFLSNFTQVVGQ